MSKEKTKELQAETMWARPEEDEPVYVELKKDPKQEHATKSVGKTCLIFLGLIIFVKWATSQALLDDQLGFAMVLVYLILFTFRMGFWWRGTREED